MGQSGDVQMLHVGPSSGTDELRLKASYEKHRINCSAESGNLIISFSDPTSKGYFFAEDPYRTLSRDGSRCSTKKLGSDRCATCLPNGYKCELPATSTGVRHPHLCIDSAASKSTCYNDLENMLSSITYGEIIVDSQSNDINS